MASKVPVRRWAIHHTQARTAATATAEAAGYQAAGSPRHLASTAAAIPANSAATPSCGTNPSAASPARPTSTQRRSADPSGWKATNATTRTAWCNERAPTRNEPASHAGPTAASKARSGSGPGRHARGHEGKPHGDVHGGQPQARRRCLAVGPHRKRDQHPDGEDTARPHRPGAR